MFAKPGGGSRPNRPFDIVTPYVRAPLPTGIAPASATVVVEPEPEAELCAPSACADTTLTPLHAEIRIPASVTGCAKIACTQSSVLGSGFGGSGKFCTLVAT